MNRPKVIVHQQASLDGRLTLSPDTLLLFGDPRWSEIAGPGDDVYAGLMEKYQPQAILEGSGSFVLDSAQPDPLPPVEGDPAPPYEDYLPEDLTRTGPPRRWFTVPDSRGRVRWFYKEFPGEAWQGWHLLVLVASGTPPAYLQYLRSEHIPYLVAGKDRVDFNQALAKLQRQLGVETVLSTGGGRLNGALLRQGLIDEVEVEFLPALIGGRLTSSLFTTSDLLPGERPTRLSLLEGVTCPDGKVRLHYAVERP